MNILQDLPGNIMRRRIPGIAAVYVGAALAALGAIDDLSDGLGWPPQVFDIALRVLCVGLLNAMIFAWFHGQPERQSWTRREGLLHMISLALLVVLFIPFGGDQHPAPSEKDPGRIVVSGIVATAFPGGTGLADSLTGSIISALGSTASGIDTPGPGARWLVSGSVSRSGDDVRISIHLVDSADNLELWADRYIVRADSIGEHVPVLAAAISDSILSIITRNLTHK